ncbi:MAG: VWA-like domain-containing protein [Nitrososphaerota archaeon]|nr:VWA-like domain-containing protein [Nitrososphaerota archaeon]
MGISREDTVKIARAMDIVKQRRQTVLFHLLLLIRKEVTDVINEGGIRCPACVTFEHDEIKVLLDREYLGKVSEEEVATLLAHEAYHVYLRHFERQAERDRNLWNIATDLVINSRLLRDGYSFDGLDTIDLRKFDDIVYKVAWMTAEQVYDILAEAQLPTPATAAAEVQSGSVKRDSAKKGKGSGKIRDDIKDEVRRLAEATKRHKVDEHRITGEMERNLEKMERYKRKADELVKRAEENAYGMTPGSGRKIPKLRGKGTATDWRKLLMKYLKKRMSPIWTYLPPDSRFYPDYGIILENSLKHERRQLVVVIVDNSGSIDDPVFKAFMNDVERIANLPEVRVNYDFLVFFHDKDVYGPYTLAELKGMDMIHGGGGTDFRPAFEAVESLKKERKIALVIWLTDGEGKYPERRRISYPLIWVMISKNAKEVPFGHVVLTEVRA